MELFYAAFGKLMLGRFGATLQRQNSEPMESNRQSTTGFPDFGPAASIRRL